MTARAVGLFLLLARDASAWGSCRKFSEIYASGQEMCEVLWADAFEYTADESAAYTMWFFDQVNPNNAVAASLGKIENPDTCELQYFHKSVGSNAGEYATGVSAAPSPEGDTFTECHPWKENACCHEAVVTTPTAINEAYGEGFHWDRCGTLSEACERFFVQEACFYECSPHAGQYRRYSNGEAFAFYAWSQIDGNPGDPFYAYAADDPIYDGTFEHEGVTYNKSVFYGDGLYGPNQWQMYKMPIKASYCDAMYTACAHDYFCGGGGYFDCAADYHAEAATNATRDEALALEAALEGYPADIQAEVRAANVSSTSAAAMADELLAAQSTGGDGDDVPEWAIALIAVFAAFGLGCCCAAVFLAKREKDGAPVFTSMEAATVTATKSGVA